MIADFGFFRVAAVVPQVRPGAVAANVSALLQGAVDAARDGCEAVVFPELAITGYTCADLFGQEELLRAAAEGLRAFAAGTAGLAPLFAVGLPVAVGDRLYNCAAVVCRGEVLGVVPKSYLPGYHEYYEPRWFAAGAEPGGMVRLADVAVPFGSDLLFRFADARGACVGIEVCEDLWAPIPPSSFLALDGATVILNPSASNDLVGKSEYRLQLVRQQSARCLAAYVYCSAGVGESTTDMVFGGDVVIAENGAVVARGERYLRTPQRVVADLDIAFLRHERLGSTTFAESIARHGRGALPPGCRCREVCIPVANVPPRRRLSRAVEAHPFTPANAAVRHERCQEVFAIQSTGLATRLEHCGLRTVVIGLSGGLDSTLALLVCMDAFQRLGLPVDGIHAITMPGFGTSTRTRANAEALCRHLGIALETIAVSEACRQHLAAIGHDGTTADITYENAQARERTQILMDKANLLGALVIGTGDLSELALGWCTYNGDHMSMYAVNTGVPKTLVSFLIAYYADDLADAGTAGVLRSILDTPISPELLPPDRNGDIAQKTESVIGPYELHDFFLYHAVRRGSGPRKVLFLACQAFGGRYGPEELRRWLRLFYVRFFGQQFKRSCLPDGPKVGTIALSPRGDWRMPSDADAGLWVAAVDQIDAAELAGWCACEGAP